MAAIPQGAFAACKIRENRECLELTPVKYNSKLMNSIWGMYNRYSPYNFKKSNDTEIAPFVAGDQKFSSGLPANAMEKKSVAHKGGTSQPNGQSWDIGLPHTCTY
uniref:Putative product n=1 Tax=Xenopsylla cheopis TaxID=163159 RepID=A0A6M2DCM6_XENCH